jgi:hypothetical protein
MNSPTYSSSSITNGQIVSCQLTNNDYCVTTNSALSNDILINVSQIINPTITISSNTTSICGGETVNFVAISNDFGANPVYQWYVDGIPTVMNSTTFSSSSISNGQTITCELFVSEICSSNPSVISNSIQIEVTPVLSPSISINSSLVSICNGENIDFSSTVLGEGSNPIYQWFLDGNPVGSDSPIYSSTSLINGQTISCQLTNNDNCVTTNNVISNDIEITVSPIINPSILINSNTTSICDGETVNFVAISNDFGTNPVYQWYVNGVQSGSNSSTFSSSLISNGQTISCELFVSEFCTVNSSVVSNSITINVAPILNPNISIDMDNNKICVDESILFTATAQNTGSNPSYQWVLNNSYVGTNSSTINLSNLNNGDFVYCILNINDQCSLTDEVISNIKVVNVIEEATITLIDGTLSTTTNGNTYQWIDCGTGIEVNGETSSDFTPSITGSYYVAVTLDNCTVNSICLDVIVLSLNDINSEYDVFIYPNPTNNKVYIKQKDLKYTNFSVKSISGQVIFEKEITNFIEEFDLFRYESGIYFIEMKNKDSEIITTKIVKN